MPRTTLNIDPTVLQELKRRGEAEGKALGELASELLAGALVETEPPARPLRLRAKPMRARVDLEDRDAVQRVLDRA